ncbi:MAG: response regulator [Lachnospiraceae bacterium]|nr:response regulator [Lachnospiraceae bacterium]
MAEKKKKRILLLGDNEAMIDDMFTMLGTYYDLVTTSIRFEDMENHIAFFEPDLLLLATAGEGKNMQKVITLKRRLTRENIVFVVFGSQETCHNFQKISGAMADLILPRPITVDKIREMIEDKLEEIAMLNDPYAAARQAALAAAAAAPTPAPAPVPSLIPGLGDLYGAAPTPAPAPTARKHVLVIDDDPMMLKIVKDHLHDKYDVATAVSGKVAYKFLEKKTTDIILLDYEMPGENGPAVLQNLRENPEVASIPVIFLTGVADRDKIREVLSLKPQGYLLKPIDKEKLLGTLDKFI